MLVIRFLRKGKKKQPTYKIVVTEKTNAPQGGRFVEQVGFYNPQTKEKIFNSERILYWIKVGAKPSTTLHNLLVENKIIEGSKIKLHFKKKESEAVAGQLKKEEAPTEEAKTEAVEETKAEEMPAEETKTETIEEAKPEEAPAEPVA